MSEKGNLIAVLASGRGSNLQAIIDACSDGRIDGSVRIVISDVPDAYALERARIAGIEAVHIPWRKKDKPGWESEAARIVREADCDIICLAGFMRVLGKNFLDSFPRKILNIHPALLPSFPGLHAQEQAYNWGVKVSGCTVHFVTSDLDMGPIVIQKTVPVAEDDTAETLADRILVEEHKAYPEAVQLVLSGRAKIDGRRVKILPQKK